MNENIDEFFESQILMKVKNYLAQIITEQKICIFEIDQQLEKISNDLKEKLKDDFKEFGIKLNQFFVTTIAKPEDDKNYLKFKELYFNKSVSVAEAELKQKIDLIEEETEAKKTVIASSAQATKRKQENYTYQEEQSYNIGKKMADNKAIGEYTNIGIGLGMISGVGGELSNKVSGEIKGAFTKLNKNCPNCHKIVDDNSAFCSYCGTKLVSHKFCSKCGSQNSFDAMFCYKCGERID